MNRITIAEPCHENWAAMTPTQQGAFCGKCQIDVVDFSGKSAEEVRQILQENVGKHLCGRFKKTQLDDINEAYLEWDNQSPRTFQSKFLYACLIVFGMTLFSCNTPEQMIMGEIGTMHIENVDKPEKTEDVASQDVTNVTEDDRIYLQDLDPKFTKGKVKYDPQTSCEKKDTLETEFVKGEIAVVPEPTVKMGLIAYTPEPEITDTAKVNTPQNGNMFSLKVFPNPAGNASTITLLVYEKSFYQVELYTISGELVRSIFAGELTAGENNFRIDLSTNRSGTYLVRVSSQHQTESYQLIKAG